MSELIYSNFHFSGNFTPGGNVRFREMLNFA